MEIDKKLELELKYEDVEQLIAKRKLEDEEQLITANKRVLSELTDFALEIIDKLDSSDESKQQIVHLALEKNDIFINIKESLTNESTKIDKFIALMNSQFKMVSILDNVFLGCLIIQLTSYYVLIESKKGN
jgi:hypothetical protein